MTTCTCFPPSDTTKRNLATAMVVNGFLLFVMSIVSGVDLTRILTSPTRIIGKLGGGFAAMIGGSRAVPSSMRAGGGQAFLRSVGTIATNIAVVQLIGFLPMPYNLILFFLYYKAITGMIICVIPLLFSLWALTTAWGMRKGLLQHLADADTRPLIHEGRSFDDDDQPVYSHGPGVHDQTPVVYAHGRHLRDPHATLVQASHRDDKHTKHQPVRHFVIHSPTVTPEIPESGTFRQADSTTYIRGTYPDIHMHNQ
jgi:hypothetical protein